MSALLLTALGLAVAGIDPAGALIAIAALARNVSPRAVVGFAGVIVVGTATLGSVLSLTFGQQLATIDVISLLPDDDLGAIIEIAIGAALLTWAALRLRRPAARPKRPRERKRVGTAGLLGLGALFALSAVLDPTFVGLVVVAGRDESTIAVVLAHALWITVSQLPLVTVAIAATLGAHTGLVAASQRRWAAIAPAARVALTVVLASAGLVLVADALTQLATGEFLIAPDA